MAGRIITGIAAAAKAAAAMTPADALRAVRSWLCSSTVGPAEGEVPVAAFHPRRSHPRPPAMILVSAGTSVRTLDASPRCPSRAIKSPPPAASGRSSSKGSGRSSMMQVVGDTPTGRRGRCVY